MRNEKPKNGLIKDNKDIKIKWAVKDMLKSSHNAMVKKINKILNSGMIDIENWDENNNPAILPKAIVTALLEDESKQYKCKGTYYEKQIQNEVNNIKYCI